MTNIKEQFQDYKLSTLETTQLRLNLKGYENVNNLRKLDLRTD